MITFSRTSILSIRSILSISCCALSCAWPATASYAAAPPQDAGDTNYVDRETGLSFSYPANATIERNPDKDTIVKLSGALPTGAPPRNGDFFVVTINRNEMAPGSDPAAAVRMLDQNLFPQLSNYSSINNERKLIGKHSQFDADIRTISHELNGIRVRQKWIVLKDPQANNRLSVITVITPEKDATDLDRLSAKILASLDHPVSGISGTNTNGTAPTRRSTFDGISLTYPADWTVQHNPDRDTLLKLQSGNLELHVSSLPAEINISIDQMQRMVDDDILSKLPHYKKLSDTARHFGTGAAGMKETFSGESEGVPAFGQAFFFPYSNKLYCVIMTSWGMDQLEAEKRFDTVLGSMVMH